MPQKNIFDRTVHCIASGCVGALLIVGLLLLYPQAFGFVGSGSVSESSTVQVNAVDVADVVERINPSVVSIVITKDVPIVEQYFEDPFSEFFGGNSPFRFSFPRYRQNGTQEKEIGGGSGFLVSKDGYVVTNAHVLSDKEAQYTVFTNDETKYDAKVVAIDDVLDIALIKIEGNDFPFLTFGDSDELRLGQGVIAIGNALAEFRNTVSTGVISGLSRSIVAGTGVGMSETLENVIQTDAAINPGNSGGPLLDFAGQVIGVNVAVASNSENIGFSLPSNVIKASVDSMIENGKVIRPYLGIRYVPVTQQLKDANNLSVNYGALIVRGEKSEELGVVPGSPADKAGLEENDIVLEIDGVKIDNRHSLAGILRTKRIGDTIKIKVLHDGKEKDIEITLEEITSSE